MKDLFPDITSFMYSGCLRPWGAAIQLHLVDLYLAVIFDCGWLPPKPSLEKNPRAADLIPVCLIYFPLSFEVKIS